MTCLTYHEHINGFPPHQVLTAYMWVPGVVVHAVAPLPQDPAAQRAEIEHVRRQLAAQLARKERTHG